MRNVDQKKKFVTDADPHLHGHESASARVLDSHLQYKPTSAQTRSCIREDETAFTRIQPYVRADARPRPRVWPAHGYHALMDHIKAWHGLHQGGGGLLFPPPLQIACHGHAFLILVCLAIGWWRWVRLISLPPYYRLATRR